MKTSFTRLPFTLAFNLYFLMLGMSNSRFLQIPSSSDESTPKLDLTNAKNVKEVEERLGLFASLLLDRFLEGIDLDVIQAPVLESGFPPNFVMPSGYQPLRPAYVTTSGDYRGHDLSHSGQRQFACAPASGLHDFPYES